MSFSDDELPPGTSSSSAGPYNKKQPIQGDRVRLVAHGNEEAPLEQHKQQVLLEITDASSPVGRAGLDLVAVLDVSRSMSQGRKLDKVKTAMKFVISKLGPNDRLSIVSFSTEAEKRCGLLCMTGASQENLKGIVDSLKAGGSTNMKGGLKTGLDVLARRRHRAGRVGSILLMSDGAQDPGVDDRAVNIGDVAVYTFGFGQDNDAKVLEAIASNSLGGTFYFVKDGASLSEQFSQILAGLLSVVVQDLKLTVWQQHGCSEIDEVHAGAYPKTADDAAAGSFTVSFGDLYCGEARKVLVDLLLPAVHRECPPTTVLFALCHYRTQGRGVYAPPDYLRWDMRRTRTARPDVMKPEVKAELVRRRHADKLKEASEEKDLSLAKRKLQEAKEDLDAEQQLSSSNPRLMHALRAELTLLLSLASRKEFISCLLDFRTSHQRQRSTGWSDVHSVFDTPLMPRYREQAKAFNENPDMPPPSVEEDHLKEEAEIPATDHQPPRPAPRIWASSPERRSSGWAWRLCAALAIALILAGAAVLAVYLLYKPKEPYLVVSDARLGQLRYSAQDGAIQYLQACVTILADNNKSKAAAAFSRVDLALAFHGADVALLRAEPFVLAPETSQPLRYDVVSAGTALDAAGMQAMDEALRAGVVPLDLVGKARTRWKVGVFVKLKFWTRVSCRLRFFFPGNGTVMPDDRQRCRSKSP